MPNEIARRWLMAVSCPFVVRVTMMLTVVAAAAGSVGCEGAPVESRARPSVPADTPTTVRPDPILTFGPESLHA